MVAAPGAVFPLYRRQPRSDRLAPFVPFRAAGLRECLGAQHVRDVLLSAVGTESADEGLILEVFLGRLSDRPPDDPGPRSAGEGSGGLVERHPGAVTGTKAVGLRVVALEHVLLGSGHRLGRDL